MTVATERDRIQHLFSRVERVEEVAKTFEASDERRQTLLSVASEALAECGPVRARIAADLLQLSEPTVRVWVREGVLSALATSPRLLLDPSQLHDVIHLVRDLRDAGRTTGLLEAVWYRLKDRALLDREDLNESLEQMRHGIGREIHPDELRHRDH
jgi:hypothetical protein